jgi:hypothetical protein
MAAVGLEYSDRAAPSLPEDNQVGVVDRVAATPGLLMGSDFTSRSWRQIHAAVDWRCESGRRRSGKLGPDSQNLLDQLRAHAAVRARLDRLGKSRGVSGDLKSWVRAHAEERMPRADG